jgi:polyhydroxyalkanoate synthesis regulator phasin
MEDLLKKILYTGVGIAALTAEKLQQVVDGLIKENKLTKEEGKKIVDDLFENAKTKKDELETQLKSVVEKTVSNFDFATKKEVEALKKRVNVLESKVNGTKAKKPAPKTAKKPVATKV